MRLRLHCVVAFAFLLLCSERGATAQCLLQKLYDSGASGTESFGAAVAIDGLRMIAGSPGDDGAAIDAGSASILEHGPNGWQRVAELFAGDPDPFDGFGRAVALSADRVLVGAPSDSAAGVLAGAAYVFERVGSVWVQAAKLLAADGAPVDLFGSAVALAGDIALVGAPRDDDKGESSGSVYVFQRTSGGWTQVAKLLAPDGAPQHKLGTAVALQGNVALVGAPEAAGATPSSGAAYYFSGLSGSWSFQTKLSASDGTTGDTFGASLAIDGPFALIGAPHHGAGRAYVFLAFGGTVTQLAALVPTGAQQGERFGTSVAIDGDRALVGSVHPLDLPLGVGAMTLFERSGAQWTEGARLVAPDAASGDGFGASVALSADSAISGAAADDDSAPGSGAAYVWSVAGVGCPQLLGLPERISVLAGGAQDLVLNAGSSHAGALYALLGSASGTSPGLVIDGLTLPLNFDAWFVHTVLKPNAPPSSGFAGILDAAGRGAARFSLPAFSPANLSGTLLHHAFLVYPSAVAPAAFVSGATPLQLVP